jgi:hypothetical protein
LSFRAARRRDDVGVLAATRAATRRAARMHDSNARVGRVGPSVRPSSRGARGSDDRGSRGRRASVESNGWLVHDFKLYDRATRRETIRNADAVRGRRRRRGPTNSARKFCTTARGTRSE